MGKRGIGRAATAVTATVAVVAAGLVAGVPAASAAPRSGTTFHVTSTSMCGGVGTLERAVTDANRNPGADTIVFDQPGLQVDVSSCFLNVPGFDYGLNATESVDIRANGATFNGNLLWVSQSGSVNDANLCPRALGPNAHWVQYSTGFMLIGAWGQDNSGVTVSVTDAHFNGLPSLVETTGSASFTMTDSTATKTVDFLDFCNRPAIAALDGGEIRLVNSRIEHSALPGRSGFGGLVDTNRATVVLDRVFLGDNRDDAAVRTTSGPVTVVSSTLGDTGGLWLGAASQIVNSAFFSSGDMPADRVVTVDGTTSVTASTFYWLNPVCPSCDPAGPPGVGFRTTPAARFRFASSAVGANLFADPFGPPFSGPLLPDNTANVSTGRLTWVQPTRMQDAAALAVLVPDAKTGAPGLLSNTNPYNTFYVDAITPLLGSAAAPGLLIDAVPDATCPGGANALRDPVNGGCITTDVLGNERVDGNGRRSIGAVQTVLAPHLAVTGSGDGFVTLAWNRPADPSSGPVTGYVVGYRPQGSASAFTRVDVPGATTLARQITGLTNGTPWEFVVSAVNQAGDGPASNAVTATPVGPIATPVVTATPGAGAVTLAWPVPDRGGHPGPLTYAVTYRQQGATTWLNGPADLAAPTAVVTPLASGVAYEFGVVAVAADGTASSVGLAVATPGGDIPPPPTVTVTDVTRRTMTVSWTKQREPASGPVTGYVLYVAAPGQPFSRFPVSGANTLSLTLGGLTPDTAYQVYVRGVNAIGEGPPSAVVTGRTLPDAHLDYPLGRGQRGVAISPLVPHTHDVTEPRQFSVVDGALPAGLALDPRSGVISGTPRQSGRTVVTVRVRGANGGVATTDVTIVVTEEPVRPTLSYPTGRGQVGRHLDPLTPHVAGLSGTLSYRVVSGTLPPGVRLDARSGIVSGRPERHGRYRATVEVTGDGGSATARVGIAVRTAPRPPAPVRQRQRPAKAAYGPPPRIAASGSTVVTPAGAVTNAGQPIRTRVTCTPLLRTRPTGDVTWCRVTTGPGSRVTVTPTARTALRVVVVQSAPGTARYRAYRQRAVYVDGTRR